jgi:N-acetylneuraminic acid mutarotase
MNTRNTFLRVRSPTSDNQRRRRRLMMERLEDRHLLSGVWNALTPMPAPRNSLNAVELGGQLQVAGGHNGSTGGTTTVFVYDTGTDTWSNGASMLGRRYGGSSAVVAGKHYVPGGWNWPDSGIPTNTLQVYNPSTTSWSYAASMPQLSGCSTSTELAGELYVTTACDGYSGYRNYLQKYNPTTNTWANRSNSAYDHGASAAAAIGGQLSVFGGYDDGLGIHGVVEKYDPASNSWSTVSTMPTPR